MARPASTDPYVNMRFHLVDPTGGRLEKVGGFTTLSLPEITQEPVEYREGVDRWTRKFPGVPTVGEVTCAKGTVRRESDFYKWLMDCINGGPATANYRADLQAWEFHITDEFGIDGSPSRILHLYECFPTTLKPMSDKDATGSEIALLELTLAVERVEVQLVTK